MASVIDITRPRPATAYAAPEGETLRTPQAAAHAETRAEIERRTRSLFASRITRLIFVCNFLGLFVLFIGVLFLSETRTRLTQAQYQSLLEQGELVANIIVVNTTSPLDTEPWIRPVEARTALLTLAPSQRRDGQQSGLRIRIFDALGAVIADTDVLAGRVDVRELPPPNESVVNRSIRMLGLGLANAENWRITPWRPTISIEAARQAALRGETAQGQALNERNRRVVMVSRPIQRVQGVAGFLVMESADVERILMAERLALLPFVLAAAIVTCLASTLLALIIANPLRRLAAAADRLRTTGATRLRIPELTNRKDEIGDLASSLEAMTAALAGRIDLNERFAADVSHEIKNPLASIRSAVDTIRAVKDPAQQAKLLSIVAADANRLDRLVTDIARATRLDAETARTHFEHVDLARLASDIVSAYEHFPHDATEATVRFDAPVVADAVVLGQSGPLGQVLRNLIDNARSFSPRGGVVRVAVTTQRRRNGGFARVSVEDQGPGVPPENLETIFVRFYTDRPKGAAFGGNSGLGLSIARQIVEAHKGRIWAENVSGPLKSAGARLIFELPVAPGPRT